MLFTVLVCDVENGTRSIHEDRVHGQPALALCSTVSYARAQSEIADWASGAREAAEKMEQTWKKAGYEPPDLSPLPTKESILIKAKNAPDTAVAVEAFWDGDTYGWFVVLTIIYLERTAGRPRYGEFDLAVMRGRCGDFRLFIADVPPWPEAELAKDVGEELSRQLRVPFYFASPDQPKDCPRWRESR